MNFPITIESQEQFDSYVKERLDRQEKNLVKVFDEKEQKLKEKFEDEKKTLSDQITGFQTQVADLTEKFKDYDDIKNSASQKDLELIKVKSAIKFGLPMEMADRLSGDDLEAIEKDAEVFAKFMKPSEPKPFTPPTPAPEPKDPEDGVTKLFKELNPNLDL